MRTDTTFAIYVTILMIFIWKQSGTSHGKSACDGIGGTVKRPASKASLKRPAHNQILTPLDMFSYCESDVTGIKFFYMSSRVGVKYSTCTCVHIYQSLRYLSTWCLEMAKYLYLTKKYLVLSK